MRGHKVLVRDPGQTEMTVPNAGEAKGLARRLIGKGKAFDVWPNEDGSWSFLIDEYNEPNRWEAA